MQIEGGTGNGFKAKVTENNMLTTLAVTESIERHINQHDGKAFNMLIAVTPAATDDCFAYIKNGADEDLVIEGFALKLAATESIYFKLGDTGTAGGSPTTVTPANLNAGSGHVAEGTFYTDPDITGLSGGIEVDRYYNTSGTTSVQVNFEQDLIIPKNQTCTIWAETGTVALHMVIYFHYYA